MPQEVGLAIGLLIAAGIVLMWILALARADAQAATARDKTIYWLKVLVWIGVAVGWVLALGVCKTTKCALGWLILTVAVWESSFRAKPRRRGRRSPSSTPKTSRLPPISDFERFQMKCRSNGASPPGSIEDANRFLMSWGITAGFGPDGNHIGHPDQEEIERALKGLEQVFREVPLPPISHGDHADQEIERAGQPQPPVQTVRGASLSDLIAVFDQEKVPLEKALRHRPPQPQAKERQK